MPQDFVGHFVRVADQQRAVGTALCVNTRAGHGRPAAFLADIGHRLSVAGEKRIGSL
jgi:hypothetical protein